jgi:pantetheine-phosphate adenylyltransferase
MPLNPRIAVYTGTFDPVHRGHLDVIRRGSRLYDRLVIGVGVNPEKEPLFTPEERVELLRRVVAPFGNVEVKLYRGLTVHFVREVGARVMLRGLRTLSDMEYEFHMSLTNQNLDPEIETVFLMAQLEHSHFSGQLIRQIGQFGGDLDMFLPPEVQEPMRARLRERNPVSPRPERSEGSAER